MLVCGSVDDGKSTLLGRLLHDCGLVPEDQLAAWHARSQRYGTTGATPDPALLLDGLLAEAEQGITIDVAYCFAATAHRRLILADAPGHEQYTRNMATAASTADVAVMLVDVRRGLSRQTRRHAAIARLMGVRRFVLAVNKMDLVAFGQVRFDDVAEAFASSLEGAVIQAIPISALHGDNVLVRSGRMDWYAGPALLDFLDTVECPAVAEQPVRMPVQWVNRPHDGFRGYAGSVAAGTLRTGQALRVAGSGRFVSVARIIGAETDLDAAPAGRAVTVLLSPETDIGPGEVLSDATDPVQVADQFQVRLLWLHEDALVPGRSYLLKLGTRTVGGFVSRIRHRLDLESGEGLSADILALNEIGVVNLSFDSPVAFAAYGECRALGGLIMIDRQTFATVGVGTIDYALRRAGNLAWQALDVDAAARARIKGQVPAVLWFTGLPGSGKSTIANLVERQLHAAGRHTYLLDGDNVRHGLNRDLGFTEAERVENIRRVSEVAALFADAGLIVLVAFISPYRAERDAARARIAPGHFVEIHVDTSLAECRRRDPKGLYRKAATGQIQNLTGAGAPYEPPTDPDIHVRTESESAEDAAARIVRSIGRTPSPFGKGPA